MWGIPHCRNIITTCRDFEKFRRGAQINLNFTKRIKSSQIAPKQIELMVVFPTTMNFPLAV